MQKKIFTTIVSLLTLFMLLVSCSNPALRQGVSALENEGDVVRSYSHTDNVPASQLPPGGLAANEVPQFVVFGFDDNMTAGGMRWVTDLFLSKKNPAGTGNAATYDGRQISASFYYSTTYLNSNKAEWYKGVQAGFETGNHTNRHPGGGNFTVAQWEAEMSTCTSMLARPYSEGLGVSVADIIGFRAPFLEYNTNTMRAIKAQGMLYDCSVEEGWQPAHDGTNFVWPYTLDNASPGNAAHAAKDKNIKLIEAVPGVWEIPVYVVVVPPDSECAAYGIPTGLRAKLEKLKSTKFSAKDGKITGFDWNVFMDFQLNEAEALATLKYTLDLRLKGNRAPFTFGTHSNYYTDPMRQAVLSKFIDYALTKKDVRIVSSKQLLDWMRKPVPLITGPDVEAPTVPTGLAVGAVSGETIALSWQPSTDDRAVKGYKLYLDGFFIGETASTVTNYTFTALAPGLTYELSVCAFDKAGNESAKAFIKGSTNNNRPPKVDLLTPAADITVMEGEKVALEALAVDTDGIVPLVEFMANDIVVASAKSSPFKASWVAVPGVYRIQAVGYDVEGAKGLSGYVTVTVKAIPKCTLPPWEPGVYTNEKVCHKGRHWQAKWWNSEEPGANQWGAWRDLGPCPFDGQNKPPAVIIENPVNNGKYPVGKAIKVMIAATDDRGIATIDVKVNGKLVTLEQGQGGLVWTPQAEGSYTMEAIATDTDGLTASHKVTFSAVNVTVDNPPVVSITDPLDGVVLKAGSTIMISAEASDDFGVAQVEFFLGSRSIGVVKQAPYNIEQAFNSAGTYQVKAIATDSAGQQTESKVITINVQGGGPGPDAWAPGVSYKVGDVVTYGGKTYVCTFAHTSIVSWEPGAAHALWKLQ